MRKSWVYDNRKMNLDNPAQFDTNAPFRMQVNSFERVTIRTKKWTGKKLRFTLIWVLDWAGKHYAMKIKGCLAWFTPAGLLNWQPPLSRGRNFSVATIEITRDLYELVLGVLNNSSFLKYLRDTTVEDLDAMKKEVIQNESFQIIDPKLEKVINV